VKAGITEFDLEGLTRSCLNLVLWRKKMMKWERDGNGVGRL
jgi:hypothetical protein